MVSLIAICAALGLAAICLLLSFLVPFAVYPAMAVGAMMALAGSIWFYVAVGTEGGANELMLCLIVPFYALRYSAANPDQTKRPLRLALLGAVVMLGGLVAITVRGNIKNRPQEVVNNGNQNAGDQPPPQPKAPEPKAAPKPKELADWGLAIDPDGDCKFTPDGKKSLTIEVPGTWHDLNPRGDKLNAPRVVRTVEGDFSLAVKVTGNFKPNGRSQNPDSVPSNGGGIVVWNHAGNFVRLERIGISREGKAGTFILFVEREDFDQRAEHNAAYPGGDCYLRLERKGGQIAGSVSTGGTGWQKLKPIDTLWPAQLKVGLSAANSNSAPLTVKFEEMVFTGKTVPQPK